MKPDDMCGEDPNNNNMNMDVLSKINALLGNSLDIGSLTGNSMGPDQAIGRSFLLEFLEISLRDLGDSPLVTRRLNS